MEWKIMLNNGRQNYNHQICTEGLKFLRTSKMKHVM